VCVCDFKTLPARADDLVRSSPEVMGGQHTPQHTHTHILPIYDVGSTLATARDGESVAVSCVGLAGRVTAVPSRGSLFRQGGVMSDSLAVQGGNFFYRRTDAYKNVSPPHTPQHRHSQAHVLAAQGRVGQSEQSHGGGVGWWAGWVIAPHTPAPRCEGILLHARISLAWSLLICILLLKSLVTRARALGPQRCCACGCVACGWWLGSVPP
jgi:hypothetical protein